MTHITRLPLRQLRMLAIIAAGYFIAARIGLLLIARPEGVTMLWPASGVALAALLLRERRHWPATLGVIFVVNALSHLMADDSVAISLGFALVNTLEPAMGAWLLVHFCGTKFTFARILEVVVLFGVALASNGLTALLGAAVPAVSLGAPFFAAWMMWWVAHGLGMVLVAPLIIMWASSPNPFGTVSRRQIIEGVILAAVLLAFTWLLFGPSTVAEHPFFRAYMVIPYLLWATLRFSPRGTSSLQLLIAPIAIGLTAQGYGIFAFANQGVAANLLSTQMFLGVTAVTGLIVPAILAERKRAEDALRANEERLRTFYENTSMGIYRTTPDGHILMVNPALLRMLGYRSFGELVSRNLEREGYEPTYDRQVFKAQLARDNQIVGQEAQWLCRDGSYIWVNESATAIRDERGNILYFDGTVENVTERKRAEAALRASEERLRTFYENTSMGIYRTTPGGQIVMVNPALLRMLGYTSFDELVSRDLEKEGYEPTYERQRFKTQWAREGRIVGQEAQWLCQDGSYIWVNESATAIRDERGDILYYDGTVENITERKRAEDALRASEERYRVLFERMLDGFALHEIVCDDHGQPIDYRFLEVNPAFEQLTGLRAADLIGRTVREALPGTEAYWIETYGRVALTGEPAHFENFASSLGRHFEVTAYSPQRGQFAVIFVDTTDRNRAEAALRQLSRAVEQSPASVVITDTGGRIEYVNPKFTRVTGYTLAEAIGQNPRILKSGETPPETYVELWRTITSGGEWRGELHNKKKNGELYWELASISPITDAHGNITHFVAVKEDITERKHAEQKIAQLHRLYIVLSNINQAIVRTSDRDMLLNEVCRIAVEDGRLQMAWIGLIDDATQLIEPTASHGQTGSYLDQLRISIADDDHHFGPTATAVRERRAVFCNDIEHDDLFAVWRERALAQGFRSEAVLPLTVEGRIIGTFNLYAIEPDFFDADEIQLLHELASDLSFACEALEHEQQRQRAEAEAAWQASFPRLSPSPIVEFDMDGRVRYANPAALALLPDVMTLGIDHPWLRGLPLTRPESPEEPYAIYGREIALGDEWYWQALSYVPETHSFRVYTSNIADLKRAEAALQKHARRLEVLHAIDRSILTAQSVRDTVVKALSYLQQLVDCQRAGVALFDFAAREARMFAVYADGPTRWGDDDRFPLADELIGVLRAEEVSIFDDLAALPDTAPIVPMLRAEGLRSYVVIRLGIGDQLIGAMNLAAQQAGAFHREQIEVAREVAVQLAIAIHQAQLREQIQRHATELEQRVAERTRELAAANERLTELDRLKSKFVSDVSHELRTPITSLKLYLELLEHGKPEKRPKYLIGLNEQADRMAQLIEDILDLSRLERDKATLIFAPIDLNAVVENVVIGQRARADQAGLALTFDPDPHLPAVSGEIHRLTQVVTNLVVNAVNYTPHGEVRLASFVKDDGVCLEVRDTGMGIDAADQTHLFERFYRGKRAVQSSVRGTGLGLSIVKDIVELHGGHIEVESQVNAGSTFRVWLPIAR